MSIISGLTLAFLLAMSAALPMAAKEPEQGDTISVRRAFLEMPETLLDIVNRRTRSDMLIYYDADSLWKAPNAVEGISVLEKVTPDYLALKITDVSRMAIKVLPYGKKGSEIVAAAYTITTPDSVADTELRFFDSRMRQLPTYTYLQAPEMKDFFSVPKGAKISLKDIDNIVPFPTVEYTLHPGSGELTARMTSLGTLSKENRTLVEPYLRKELTYEWDGKKFRFKH